jgi:hypothetical protein
MPQRSRMLVPCADDDAAQYRIHGKFGAWQGGEALCQAYFGGMGIRQHRGYSANPCGQRHLVVLHLSRQAEKAGSQGECSLCYG